MKKIYNIALAICALLSFGTVASAQYNKSNGFGYTKTVDGPVNGEYIITLESFVEGHIEVMHESIPANVILVLDVSSSMRNNNVTGTYYFSKGEDNEYSYNNYSNSDPLYYKMPDGTYCQVTVNRTGNPGNRRYSMTFRYNGTTYYLTGAGGYTTTETTVAGNTTTIYRGILYGGGSRRMDALKQAVQDFIRTIEHDDWWIKKADGTDSLQRTTPLGNQISIVKFAGNYYNNNANSLTPGNHANTEVLKGWTTTGTTTNVEDLIGAIGDMNENASGTSIDYGMHLASLLLGTLHADDVSSKTVVVFTDGEPYRQGTSSEVIADNAIATAKTIKATKAFETEDGTVVNTNVYTVGLFDDDPSPDSTTGLLMEYASSNFPDANSTTDPGSGRKSSDYYHLASDGASLLSIFASIAQNSGSPNADIAGSSVTMVDVVSDSFSVPVTGADVSRIIMQTADVNGKNGDYYTFDMDNLGTPPDSVKITYANNMIRVQKYDYAANMCATNPETGESTGQKLIIKIPITINDDAVGGTAVPTNAEGSGIQVNGQVVAPFVSPTLNIRVNLWIKKLGLEKGESGVFRVDRIACDNEGNPVADAVWEQYTRVFLTGTGDDNNPPIVHLQGLDPTYIYKVVELDWSWDYIATAETPTSTDKLTKNPVIFSNAHYEETAGTHHAESKVTNDFSTTGAGVTIDSKDTAAPATQQ